MNDIMILVYYDTERQITDIIKKFFLIKQVLVLLSSNSSFSFYKSPRVFHRSDFCYKSQRLFFTNCNDFFIINFELAIDL